MLTRKLTLFARLSGLLVAAFAAVVLLGWYLEIEQIINIDERYPPMRVNTAIGLCLSGCMLFFIRYRFLSTILSLVVAAIAALVLFEYISGYNLGIDQLFFDDAYGAVFDYYPGRMSLNAAISFLLISASSILYSAKKAKPAYGSAQLITLLVLFVVFAALLGYLFRVDGITGIEKHIQMAPQTAVCFALLAGGFFFLYPNQGYVSLMLSPTRSGGLIRRLFAAALALPLVLGMLILWLFQLEQYSIYLGFVLFTICYTLLFSALLFGYGREFLKTELQQYQQKQEIVQLNLELTSASEQARAANEELQTINEELKYANEKLHRANRAIKELSEEALQETTHKYKQLADSVEDVFYALDDKLRVTFWNKACEKMTGITAAQAIGSSIFPLMPKLLLQANSRIFEQVLAGGKSAHIALEDKTGDEPKHYVLRVYPARNGLMVFADDITQVRNAEQALKHQKETLELALKSAQLATWDLDVKSGNSTWSDRWYTMLGYEAGELEENFETWRSLTHPDDLPNAMKAIERHFSGETEYVLFEHRLQTKTGDWRWTIGSGKVVERDASNGPVRVIGVLQDISVLKKTELSLHFYKYLIDHIQEPIYWLSPHTLKFKYVNKATCEHYGLAEAELLEMNILDLDPVTKNNKAHMIRDEIYQKGSYHFRTVHRHSSGREIPVEITANLFYYHENPYIIGYIHNISEQLAHEARIKTLNTELERKVAQRTTELQAINKELEAFSYSVSHDLRAPLRSIDGFSKAILEDYNDKLDEDGKEFLHRIRNSTQHMGQLIDDLLNLSRVSRAGLNKEKINISALVNSKLSELMQNQPQRTVITNIQQNLYAQADPKLIRIALDNLLHNAWKYTGKAEQPAIAFGCENKGGADVFFIKDNGAGFDMKYAHKLFRAFQRLHRHDEFEGTGVGLATVQRIIHRHGGQIWAEAEPGNGASFYFTLF